MNLLIIRLNRIWQNILLSPLIRNLFQEVLNKISVTFGNILFIFCLLQKLKTS